MAKNSSTRREVPEQLKIPYKSDYRRSWMLRNGRTKSVTVSTEQLAFLLVTLRFSDAELLRELLGEQTCDAAIDCHTGKTSEN